MQNVETVVRHEFTRPRSVADRHTLWYRLAFIVIYGFALLLLMLLLRSGTILTSGVINPDEAELLATARRAALDLGPYDTYTTGTYLYLWPSLLAVLFKLGIPLSLPLAHLLSGLAYYTVVLTFIIIAARWMSYLMVVLFTLPAAIVLFMGGIPLVPDYMSLGTELLPILLICLGLIIAFGWGRPTETLRLLLTSFLVSLGFWAKPQLAPMIAVFCIGLLAASLCSIRQPKFKDSLTIAIRIGIGVALGLTLPFVILLIAGNFAAFMSEPVRYISSYLLHRESIAGGAAPSWDQRFSASANLIIAQCFIIFLAVPGLIAITQNKLGDRRRVFASLLWALPILAALLSLAVVFPLYPHYGNQFVVAILLSGILSLVAANRLGPQRVMTCRRNIAACVAAALAALIAVVAAFPVSLTSAQSLGSNVNTYEAMVNGPSDSLSAQCTRGSRVFVWGWASELYATYDWAPASRYVVTPGLNPDSTTLTPSGATLVNELRIDPPACIIDAVGEQFFAVPADQTLGHQIPELQRMLDSCYSYMTGTLADGRHVNMYVRTNAECVWTSS